MEASAGAHRLKTAQSAWKNTIETRWRSRNGLSKHPSVERAQQPELASAPATSTREQADAGIWRTFALRLRGGERAVLKTLERVRVFTLAESLGGVESLIGHPATMTHASMPPDVRQEMGITPDLFRISVGLEDVNDLIANLNQALKTSELHVQS